MALDELLKLISNNGFAIVMCLLLYYKMNKDSELHKQESNELKEAINNLTLALQRLFDKLDGDLK